MQYDFTSHLDRHGMDAIAVDGVGHGGAPGAPKEGFDIIPMWVADMNFPTLPDITQAICRRTQHPAFGYFSPTDAYYDAICGWQARRNEVQELSRENIGYENGVLGGVVSALSVMAAPGDAVLVHSPTYIGFTKSLENAGYRIVHSPLHLDEDGVWRMDFADMEEKLRANHIHAAILCSPHNPCGRVWTEEELSRAMEVYRRCDCYVISDEIWSDILLDGHKHIPTQSVSEDARQRTVALYAPSKTFNLAGLVGSYHIIYNDRLRDRVRAAGGRSHYNSMNVLSMHALAAAYSPAGAEWVDQLCAVLSENVRYACDHIAARYPGVTLAHPQGTYMLFLDCSEWCRLHNCSLDRLLRAGWDVGVAWQDGRPFHGPCAIRMNLALPLDRVREAFGRLDKYVFRP